MGIRARVTISVVMVVTVIVAMVVVVTVTVIVAMSAIRAEGQPALPDQPEADKDHQQAGDGLQERRQHVGHDKLAVANRASKPITITEAVWVKVTMAPRATAWPTVPRLPTR